MKIQIILLSLFIVNSSFSAYKPENLALSEAEQRLIKAEAIEHWKKRDHQENLEEALSKFDLIHSAHPSDLEILVYLTRGFYLLADLHLDDPSLKRRYFEKAVAFGKLALATNSAFKIKSEDQDLEDITGLLTEKEVPAMYWTAVSLEKWSKLDGFFARYQQKDKIMALIKRVEVLRPDYFFGAVPRFWAGFKEESKQEYEKSLKSAPEYLGTSVLMAEVYWTEKKDRKAFEDLLHSVLLSTQDKHPEIGPENKLEKLKAEKLLEKKNKLF